MVGPEGLEPPTKAL